MQWWQAIDRVKNQSIGWKDRPLLDRLVLSSIRVLLDLMDAEAAEKEAETSREAVRASLVQHKALELLIQFMAVEQPKSKPLMQRTCHRTKGRQCSG